MFKKGDKIRLHDGTLHVMATNGLPPRAGKRSKKALTEIFPVRGFVRGALINPDGSEQVGDWHENVVTFAGHSHIIKNFAGLAGSAAAQFWGIGFQTGGTASSDLVSKTWMASEYGTNPASAVNANGSPRANVAASQAIAGTYTLSQSWQYPATQLPDNVALNCIAQCMSSAISSTATANPALSLAVFSSSSKSNSQALNITYNWSFGT